MDNKVKEGVFQVEYKLKNYLPVIYLFKRVNGVKEVEVVENFQPYFYVHESENVKLTVKNDWRLKNSIVSVEPCMYKTLNGDNVQKVVVKSPYNIYKLRELFKKH